MNYLNKAQKSAYSKVFYDLHDTFAGTIVIFKHPNATLISSEPNYNFLYSQQTDTEIQYTPVSGVFPARIQWENNPDKVDDHKDIRPTIFGNMCRIKVKADALAFINDARGQRIEVDGRTLNWIGSSKPHGLFDADFYTIYLKEGD
jgi:hypothetical protein